MSIDKLSAWMGKAFAWCVLVMTFGVSYEIIVRKLFRDPTAWAFDISYIMYGALFMMAGAYTLSRNGHVRGDVLYRLWPPRVQALVECTLYFVLFFPGIIALIIIGFSYAHQSWGFNMGGGEVSINSPAGVPISQFKTLIPIAATLLFLQGIAEVIRCIECLRVGRWPERLHDVEEMESMLLHEKQDMSDLNEELEDVEEWEERQSWHHDDGGGGPGTGDRNDDGGQRR
jgi:TRAP-type mannitol/chloroaromatic compound transport system permease small subunit